MNDLDRQTLRGITEHEVEDPAEVTALRRKLEHTEAQRGDACAWALLYKRVSEGRPEPAGVRGTPRPLSLALDDLKLAQELGGLARLSETVTLAQWRARALKAEATLAEIRQTSMAWCSNCEDWVKFGAAKAGK